MEEISKTLDEILVGVRSFRKPRDHEDTSLIWQEYEFGTGAGNREGKPFINPILLIVSKCYRIKPMKLSCKI